MPKILLTHEQRKEINANFKTLCRQTIPTLLKRAITRQLAIKYGISENYANNLVHK